MNKKIIITITVLILIVIIGVSFFVIRNNINKGVTKNENDAKDILNNSNNTEETNNEILVVYFSMPGEIYGVGKVEVGNTAIMASYIVDYLNADSFEIVPVKNYSQVYSELTQDAKEEQQRDDRPEIKNKLTNIDNYETIFIGYPIWWGDLPQILYTFLEEYNFDGKTIIPFNTHEGSGSAGTYNTVKSKLENTNVNTNGLALQGRVARTDEGKERTINWLKELGY